MHAHAPMRDGLTDEVVLVGAMDRHRAAAGPLGQLGLEGADTQGQYAVGAAGVRRLELLVHEVETGRRLQAWAPHCHRERALELPPAVHHQLASREVYDDLRRGRVEGQRPIAHPSTRLVGPNGDPHLVPRYTVHLPDGVDQHESGIVRARPCAQAHDHRCAVGRASADGDRALGDADRPALVLRRRAAAAGGRRRHRHGREHLAVGGAVGAGADHGVAAEGRAQHERQPDGQDHDLTGADVHHPRRIEQPGRSVQPPDTSVPPSGVH